MTRRHADHRDVDHRDIDAVAATGHGAGLSTWRRGLTTAGWATKGRLDVWHRLGAVVLGVVLWAFGILGAVKPARHVLHQRRSRAGALLNGLPSVISLVVGGVLIGAAVRGGLAVSTVTVTVGAAFLPSGIANVLVLDTR